MIRKMKRQVYTILLILLAFAVTGAFSLQPAFAGEGAASKTGTENAAEEKMPGDADDGSFEKDRVLVVMKDEVSEKKAEKTAEAEGDELESTVTVGTGDDCKTMAVVDTGNSDIEDSMEDYAQRSDVEYVQPDYKYMAAETEQAGSGIFKAGLSKKAVSGNSDYTDLQWALGSDGVDATSAWDLMEGVSHSKVKVAVLDTGLDMDQPDLQTNLDRSRCYNSYIRGGSYDPYDIEDLDGHGTHVAGIIAADNNSYGVSGIASGKDNSIVSLFAVKVFDRGGSLATTSSIARGINYAVKKGAKVINLSLGADKNKYDKVLHNAVNSAYNKGVTVVCAAGNDGTDGIVEIPASYSKSISVSSLGTHGLIHKSSTYGKTVDLAAPGVNILSLYPGWAVAWQSGTSMATPAVSACAAMVYSVYGSSASKTGSFSKKVRNILFKTATDLYSKGKDIYTGYGRVNGAYAVKAASTGKYSKKSKKIKTVKVTSKTKKTVKLSWPKLSTGSKYRIQKRLSKKNRYKYKTIATTTGKKYKVKKLSPGKSYRFRIQVYETSGYGAGTWYVLGEKTVKTKKK